MVVAVPAPLFVQGNQEQVGAVDLVQHVAGVGASRDGVTQGGVESVQDGGLHQERQQVGRQRGEHFLAQVVDDRAVGAGEALDEVPCVRSVAQPQRRES